MQINLDALRAAHRIVDEILPARRAAGATDCGFAVESRIIEAFIGDLDFDPDEYLLNEMRGENHD